MSLPLPKSYAYPTTMRPSSCKACREAKVKCKREDRGNQGEEDEELCAPCVRCTRLGKVCEAGPVPRQVLACAACRVAKTRCSLTTSEDDGGVDGGHGEDLEGRCTRCARLQVPCVPYAAGPAEAQSEPDSAIPVASWRARSKRKRTDVDADMKHLMMNASTDALLALSPECLLRIFEVNVDPNSNWVLVQMPRHIVPEQGPEFWNEGIMIAWSAPDPRLDPGILQGKPLARGQFLREVGLNKSSEAYEKIMRSFRGDPGKVRQARMLELRLEIGSMVVGVVLHNMLDRSGVARLVFAQTWVIDEMDDLPASVGNFLSKHIVWEHDDKWLNDFIRDLDGLVHHQNAAGTGTGAGEPLYLDIPDAWPDSSSASSSSSSSSSSTSTSPRNF